MARSIIPFVFEGSYGRSADPFLMLHREINRLFDDTLRGAPGMGSGAVMEAPRMNVSETEQEIRIEAELPGVAEDDVQIEMTNDLLTIRGEKRTEKEDQDKNKNYHIVERSYGSFSRSIRLPFAAKPDQVSASFHNGVLTITVPKAAAQEKVHRIQVRSGSGATIGNQSKIEGQGQASGSGELAGTGKTG
ncbi:MAG TPA: Hsp20/alpha crystallin family protein [Acetobacteraceae bacterium]|nr:Hsp20/alpha crystallin family protein [Acetobacteraceae bacterium]